MRFTAKQIADLIGGVLEGNPQAEVSSLSKIEEGQEGSLSFLSNPKYESFLYTTKATVVIVNASFVPSQEVEATLIKVEDAYSAFSILLEKYYAVKMHKVGIEEPSFIHPTAKLGKEVYVGAFAYIAAGVVVGDRVKIYPNCYIGENSVLGDDTTLHAGVNIAYESILGKRITIHSGTVVGSDGFGFAPQSDGTYKKIIQTGNVLIEDDVEIGSNACIDRATIGSTIIRKGVKLDNLIQVAHNVEIGANTVVASQTGISGSSKINENCIVGGQVGIVGHISIAKGSQIQAKSGINRSIVQENKKWAGAPFVSYQDNLRSQVVIQRLPDLERRLEQMQKELQELRAKGGQ